MFTDNVNATIAEHDLIPFFSDRTAVTRYHVTVAS